MKTASPSRAALLVTASILIHLPVTATACTACMGDVNSKSAEAMNAAIFLMLGCIGSMLGGLTIFAIYLMRRANSHLSPGLDLAALTNDPEEAS